MARAKRQTFPVTITRTKQVPSAAARLLQKPAPPAGPTPAETLKLAEAWSDSQIQCRLDGHGGKWLPQRADHVTLGRVSYIYRVRRCSNCNVQKHEEVSDQTGEVYARWYDYSLAENYRIEGLGRIVGSARDALRLAELYRNYDLTEVTGGLEVRPHSQATREALGWRD